MEVVRILRKGKNSRGKIITKSTNDTTLKQSSISSFFFGIKEKKETILNQPAKKLKMIAPIKRSSTKEKNYNRKLIRPLIMELIFAHQKNSNNIGAHTKLFGIFTLF